MSDAQSSSKPVVLVVSDNSEHPLQRLGETLREHGCDIYIVPDVYAAMAYLSRGLAAEFVLVDPARLDGQEAEFLALAPQYFERSRVLALPEALAPSRNGFSRDRAEAASLEQMLDVVLAAQGSPSDASTEPPFLEDLSRDHPGDWPEAQTIDLYPPEAESAAESHSVSEPPEPEPDAAASADIPPQAPAIRSPAEPALHDAVRQRMSGFGTPPIQRTPPAALAAAREADPTISHLPTSPRELLTPEELSALLDGEGIGLHDRAGGAA